MDKYRRSRLKSVVGQARRIVEDDVRVQLRRLGIDENEIKPVERLPHLSDADKELRQKIVEAIEKEKAGDISYGEAFDRYVRHVGFTCVNRIAALRAMEVRNLIKETIIRRDVYGGRSRREYELAERERISDPFELLRAGLVEAFNEVSAEIRVLFDVKSEYSLVFLGHKALLELIRLLSEEVPEEDWKEDDIIGWIYQYFNDEARREYRKARRKPTADDIPVINQFYTPHWIVRAIVDNTLGRLWLEMHPNSKLKEFCTYLAPIKNDQSKREVKKVREIKVLDPACGSGHFLVYAFDVLCQMYKEDEPNIPASEIPSLILENNLFGIDIDLYSVQLAALSLYVKAKTHNRSFKIKKMNLVCADIRISDGKRRLEFLKRFRDDPDLERIFAKLFEDLGYTYEIGSVLKVRQPFERLFKERKRGERQARFAHAISGQTELSKRGLTGQAKFLVQTSKGSESLAMVVPKERTIEEMLEELRKFEREAIETHDIGRLLFSTETEKSVGLLALLSEKYDVVVMNPPYGDAPAKTKEYFGEHYPKTHSDYYTVFIEQTIDLAENRGYVGAITGRTFMFLKSHQKLREEILRYNALPQVILDLGFNVLDGATARYAAFTLQKRYEKDKIDWNEHAIMFFKLTDYDWDEKRDRFERSFLEVEDKSVVSKKIVHTAKLGDLANVPSSPYSYWAPNSLRDLFQKYPPLDRDVARQEKRRKIANTKVGLQTSDYARFTRLWWEVDVNNIAITNEETHQKKWVPFNKGGRPFYFDIVYLINWLDSGSEIKAFEDAVVRNEEFYFHKGLAWTLKLSWTETGMPERLKAYYMPAGVIFSHGSYACFSDSDEHIWPTLSLLRSDLVATLIYLLDPNIQNVLVATLARIPFNPEIFQSRKLFSHAKEAYSLLKDWDTGNEQSTQFIMPWILQVWKGFDPNQKPITRHPLTRNFVWSDFSVVKKIRREDEWRVRESNILALINECKEREKALRERLEQIQKEIDEEVYRIYGISDENRALIERELGFQRGVTLEEEEDREDIEELSEDVLSAKEHIERLISFYIKNTLESDPDGIMPLHELVKRLSKKLADDFGDDQVDAKEKEIQEILGESLEEWIATDYFNFHVSLYKRRPIFWQLTSSNFTETRSSVGTFNCFLYYHRLDKDTIPKIMMNHLRPEVERAKWRVDRLKRELQEARNTEDKRKERQLSEELDSASSVLEELQTFEKTLEEVRNPRADKTKLPKNPTWLQQKIAEVRDDGYNPVIDCGVRVNIEPLKEAGLLHKAAQRIK